MSKKILVPLDGSELSETTLPWLRFFAEKEDVEATIFRSFEPPSSVYLVPEMAVPTAGYLSLEHLGNQVIEYLKSKSESLADLQVDTDMTCGYAAEEILERAEANDLVLIASHGRSGLGRWLLGSVATKVARGSDKPVMIVRGVEEKGKAVQPKLDKILVPLDGSEASEMALEEAMGWARAYSASLILYQSVSSATLPSPEMIEANRAEFFRVEKYLEMKKGQCEGIDVTVEAEEDHPAEGILKVAARNEADLIIMSSHGRGGIARWMLGSVAERVVQSSDCPVLVVRGGSRSEE